MHYEHYFIYDCSRASNLDLMLMATLLANWFDAGICRFWWPAILCDGECFDIVQFFNRWPSCMYLVYYHYSFRMRRRCRKILDYFVIMMRVCVHILDLCRVLYSGVLACFSANVYDIFNGARIREYKVKRCEFKLKKVSPWVIAYSVWLSVFRFERFR